MKKPDFFVVGAPKCGTTSMCKYLDLHPEIFISKPKEPNYFCYEVIGKNPQSRNLQEYLSLFEDADSKTCGEGSPWNLYSKTAATEIYQLNSNAKIIIMLRNPVDFLYSLHSHHIVYSHENIFDFKSALEAESDRKLGAKIPSTCHVPTQLLYSEVAQFSTQVQRYLNVFGRDKVKIIIFDDFKINTAQVYQEILEFLGVDTSFDPDFLVHNSNKQVSNPSLYQFFNKPPSWMFEYAKAITPNFLYPLKRKIASTIRITMRSLLSKNKKRVPLNPKMRDYLIKQYTPEVELLSQLINRDLNHWINCNHDTVISS
ncbi:MAG: sulfotransferase domain-containing protein [Cyanobacteria bacterium J06621_8]